MRGSAFWLRLPHQTCLLPSTGAARINPESHRMETPIPCNAGPSPIQNAESLRTSRIEALRREIDELGAQKAAKEKEIRHLQAAPSSLLDKITHESGHSVTLGPKEKIALFLKLFGARRDVYPKLWENNASRKKGYSPAYEIDHRSGAAVKRFLPLDERAVEAHLRGRIEIGAYAIREDDSCIFLAADFDGDGWRENVVAYKEAAQRVGVAAAVERSRSGNGAHAWIFFSEAVPATLARRLGTILLAKASATRPTMSLGAFDRLFPNQDTIPKGGFGNLIALPLAGEPRKLGNTVFLDDELSPHSDQWAFLATVKRLSREDLDRIAGQIAPMAALASSRGDSAFALESDECALDLSRPTIKPGMISGEVTLRFDSRLHIPPTVPAAILASLKRLAAFANPVFHEKLRLRFATYDTPRFIFAGEWHADRLVIPRGAMDDAIAILEKAGANVTIQDARPEGKLVRWTFHGELRPEQEAAVQEMSKHDYGVLCAPPGAGKTVMGCALIARHRISTLVLVHRTIVLDQWCKEAGHFLGIAKRKEIGIWRGATRRLTRRLDIAMLPSLARIEDYAAFFQGYGLVIVDECHHVPAVTVEALLKACPCRKIVGLTATPVRKDGLEKLLHLQCGPIRHTMHAAADEVTPRAVYVRRSSFHVPSILGQRPPIHAVWEALVGDEGRTRQIATDILSSLNEGRCPLVLSDRKAHLDKLEAQLTMQNGCSDAAVLRLQSGVGKKQREAIRGEIDRRFEKGEKFVLLATASLIGEGYDLPRLDTLFLAMPLSFKGRVVQYAGRLHRQHAEKREVRVYDYLDEGNPLTMAMFRRRSSAYRQMGYRMVVDQAVVTAELDFR
jgi:superfamily II DNA or RNA helicase